MAATPACEGRLLAPSSQPPLSHPNCRRWVRPAQGPHRESVGMREVGPGNRRPRCMEILTVSPGPCVPPLPQVSACHPRASDHRRPLPTHKPRSRPLQWRHPLAHSPISRCLPVQASGTTHGAPDTRGAVQRSRLIRATMGICSAGGSPRPPHSRRLPGSPHSIRSAGGHNQSAQCGVSPATQAAPAGVPSYLFLLPCGAHQALGPARLRRPWHAWHHKSVCVPGRKQTQRRWGRMRQD
ncbi:hypothetical protein NDU88_002205 [Pleurodeles waltl]|uniref:Uncharacterized protein n=1 Tax=Pleurodeles waltl TaxID=8319 RepID=A0AAV7V9W9_PLEWA|nr:hypothetical protein NDU88_002205 [Pleurodeles waltl]